jgi:CheY-like chemotaxis protein
MNLIQTNRLRTSFVYSSSYRNRIEKEGRKLRYRVKKEEEEKYIESIFACKNKKLNQEASATTLSLFEKIMIVTYRERFAHKLMNSREEEYTQQEEFSSDDTNEVIKRILIMDDNPDIILTFKKILEGPQIEDPRGERHRQDNITKGKKKMSFEVITYNDPFLALSEFKPNFYHLMLVDINMPKNKWL